MTNVASKGGLRAAHAAKTAKHAQRNPQPRSHTTEIINAHVQSAPDSEAAMAAALDGTAYGRMTVVELRARAKALNIKAVSRLAKGEILTLILQAERAQQAGDYDPNSRIIKTEAEQAAEPEFHDGSYPEYDELSPDTLNGEPVAQPATVAATATELEPKGAAKAVKLLAAISGHGWTSEGSHGEDDRITFVARRGGETLTVVWVGGVYQYDESVHVVHDRNTRLRNVSAAVKLAARPKEAVEAEYGKVISNRRFRPAVTKAQEGHLQGVPADRRLFTNPGEVTREELWAALAGYRVVWVNRVSNMTESATVSQSAKFFNVRHNPAGELMVEFCTVGMGFRACRVADIVSTSRKAGKARRSKTLPGGEEVRAA